ncbi:hypothetical protein [Antrihabitans spumae]|uniref:Uncharacterized protein n=1 Tax=Antrihabitans spumae TaxID=3373370 RepID=A0ABW7KAB0_9NOCA
MAKQVGSILTAAAPIAQVAAAVHKAVYQKPRRSFKYLLMVGMGESWSIERLGLSDPRRYDGANPVPAYDLVDALGMSIHVTYRQDGVGTSAAIVGFGFDPPKAAILHSEKFAQRTAELLAEVGVQASVDKLKA